MSSYGAPSPDAAVYVISVAAELTGLHPQTLRTYERMGLITPGRTVGGGRRYSHRDLELLRRISDLTSAGIGLEGVRRILELDQQVVALQSLTAELQVELEGTREALRQAHATVQALTRSTATRAPSRLPAIRQGTGDAAVVVWRRGVR